MFASTRPNFLYTKKKNGKNIKN